jgi:hypothetical protein
VNLGGAVNLNAKKLEIDFDNDDFFNSFEPTVKINTKSTNVSDKTYQEQKLE